MLIAMCQQDPTDAYILRNEVKGELLKRRELGVMISDTSPGKSTKMSEKIPSVLEKELKEQQMLEEYNKGVHQRERTSPTYQARGYRPEPTRLPFLTNPLSHAVEAFLKDHGGQISHMILNHPMFLEIPGIHDPEVRERLLTNLQERLRYFFSTKMREGVKSCFQAIIYGDPDFYRGHLRPIWQETYPEGVKTLEKHRPHLTPPSEVKTETAEVDPSEMREGETPTEWFQRLMGE
jgi:hypothetical protein